MTAVGTVKTTNSLIERKNYLFSNRNFDHLKKGNKQRGIMPLNARIGLRKPTKQQSSLTLKWQKFKGKRFSTSNTSRAVESSLIRQICLSSKWQKKWQNLLKAKPKKTDNNVSKPVHLKPLARLSEWMRKKKSELAKLLAEATPETLLSLGIDATIVEKAKRKIVGFPQKEGGTKTPTFSMASESGDSHKDEHNDIEDDEPKAKSQRMDHTRSPTSPIVFSPTSPAPDGWEQDSGLDESMGENAGEPANVDEASVADIIEETWQATMEVHKKENDEATHTTWVENKQEWIGEYKEKLRSNEKNGSRYQPF